jgi:uncharacterized protein (DUF2236 family)
MNSRSDQAIVLPGILEASRATQSLIGNCVKTLSAADPGYFGPGSVSWRILSHASYGASGIAAVLMQAMHPVAMAIVDRRSSFRTDAWRRAHLTADYVFVITFSARETADAAAARVRAIHSRISGADPATGSVHRADGPDLLLWIHAVHTEFAIRGYSALAGDLSPQDADRFVAEQVKAAELVGLEAKDVPHTRQELRDYIASVPGLRMSDPAMEFARMLLHARMPLAMRPFWALHVAAAAALLPEDVRSAYRFPAWLPNGRAAMAVIRGAFRAINQGYRVFGPVRKARSKLREVELQVAKGP